MSLLAPRPAQAERASVVLPTVTCSSCSDSIPLSSLGEHICRSAPRPTGRSAPRPSQIAIPTPGAQSSRAAQSAHSAGGSSWRGPSSFDRAPPRPAFAGPSSAVSSPGSSSLMIPDVSSGRSSPIGGLSPHGGSPSPRTPSPTNPFFPQMATDSKPSNSGYGLGLTVGSRPEGPFPTDAPLPQGASDLSTLSGESGMAGVGRRAFQAAAWGVTAGITMAQSVRNRQEQTRPPLPPSSFSAPGPAPLHQGSRSAGPVPSSLPPWQSQMPVANPAPSSAPFHGRQRSGTDAQENGNAPIPQRSASALDRPVQPFAAPPRSSSAMGTQPSGHAAKPSVASTSSSRSSYDHGDSVAKLLRARTDERKGSSDGKGKFFDKYKEMQRTTSNSSGGTSRLVPVDPRRSPEEDEDRELVDSPRQSASDLEDEASALPWATPALAASPDIKQGEFREKTHQRQPTAGSDSSSGSSRSGRYGASGASCEEVVTPSGSIEGLSIHDRANGQNGSRAYGARPLKQIHEMEEDENDRVIFGTPVDSPPRTRNPRANMIRSESNSTIDTTTKDSTTSHSHSHSHSRSRTAPVRRIKMCQKCGETVGGTKKFVERDGVVLCEADWKKMYLPTCRKCSKLIETKMVSADDGQLKGKWHSHCFTCTRCDEPFGGGDFYVHAGKPWCQYHYAQETGTLCASSTCRRPIEGACVVTAGSNPQRFHPGHLGCDAPHCSDTMEEYYELPGKRLCERHMERHVREARAEGHGLGKELRAEKRKTRLVDLPRGAF